MDVGSKRIGLAVSDELGIIARGLPTLHRGSPKDDIQKIIEIVKQYKVEKIVVGLPRNMDGSVGNAAEQVLSFVQGIKKQTEIPIEVWDERLSTVAVTRTLLSADVSRRRRKKVVDTLAAVYILQGFLDKNKHSGGFGV